MKLKNVLLINAISSGATGILLTAMPNFFAELFAVGNSMPFTEVGIFLILFSMFVFITALSSQARKSRAKIITALDVTWVIASAVVVVILFSSISTIGSFLIIGVAVWVGLMAYLQNKNLQSI